METSGQDRPEGRPSPLHEEGLAQLQAVLPEDFEVSASQALGLDDAVDAVWEIRDATSHISTCKGRIGTLRPPDGGRRD